MGTYYRVIDDREAGNRHYNMDGVEMSIRDGYPATESIFGGKGGVKLSDAWLDLVCLINGPVGCKYLFVDYKNYPHCRIFKPNVGWHNKGYDNLVEQLTFSGNIVDVYEVIDNRAYIRCFYNDQMPPAPIWPDKDHLDPLVQLFTTQYHNKLDMTIDGKYPRTLIIANPGERLWIPIKNLRPIELVIPPENEVDMTEIMGKSIFIWNIPAVYGGDVGKIASELKAGGFQSIIIHETNVYNWRSPARIALVAALKAVGIKPFGGAAIYGANPAIEGQRAGAICKEFGLAGFVFDAEAAFDKADAPDSAAARVVKEFRATAQPGALAGWCWWAFYQSAKGVTYHPKGILWAAMAKGYGDADFGIPMMYWSWGDDVANAVKYLEESFKQWRAITNKPIIPAGRAYIGDGGTPTPAAMIAFEQRARALGADGVTWWSMQHAINDKALPGIWQTLCRLQPFGEVTPPVVEPPVVTEPTDAEKFQLMWAWYKEEHA
jgi:hypothetical protein